MSFHPSANAALIKHVAVAIARSWSNASTTANPAFIKQVAIAVTLAGGNAVAATNAASSNSAQEPSSSVASGFSASLLVRATECLVHIAHAVAVQIFPTRPPQTPTTSSWLPSQSQSPRGCRCIRSRSHHHRRHTPHSSSTLPSQSGPLLHEFTGSVIKSRVGIKLRASPSVHPQITTVSPNVPAPLNAMDLGLVVPTPRGKI